jgi:hypothetical protein
MANKDWPESRARLLEDIETFARSGPPPIGEEKAPEPPHSIPDVPSAVVKATSEGAPAAKAPGAAPATSASSASPPSQPVGGGMLAILKQQALAKLKGEDRKEALQSDLLARINVALEMTFHYLNDLTCQLNILKPPYTKIYTLFGVADFDEMSWHEGRTDYRMRKVSTEERIYEQITLRYRLLGKKQFCLTRESPALEKTQKALFDNSISFTTDETRNDRNHLERTTFRFPCEVKAGLVLSGNFDTGKLLLRTRNIERFGIMEFQMDPEAINAKALDELTCMILGKPNRFAQLFERSG